MTNKKSHTVRYLCIVIAFCAVCMIYLGRLFYIQFSGRDAIIEEAVGMETVKIRAVRGEIYDRNGVKLVENRYVYDMALSLGQFTTMETHKRNAAFLALSEGLSAFSPELTGGDAYFPMEGTYPEYSYSALATDGDSVTYYKLREVLKTAGLKEDSDCEALCRYYTETYGLGAVDSYGMPLYTEEQIDVLIRFYYDLDARKFLKNGEYTVAEDIPMELITFVKERKLRIVDITLDVERVYLYPGYASHILGEVGPIYAEEWDYYSDQGYQMNAIVGKNGCEAAFEGYLVGKDGTMRIGADDFGNVITEVTEAPVAGKDVYLTIDIELQIAAEEGLRENVQYVVDRSYGNTEAGAGCNAGAAVVMDPDTFELLAVASYPSYDLSNYHDAEIYDSLSKDPAKPFTNRAMTGLYEPGSTFKLGMAVAALMEDCVTPSSILACDGQYTQPGVRGDVECFAFGRNHWGGLDLIDAIACSCNSYFCEVGHRLGIREIERYMGHFGFGKPTGIELGEMKGFIAGPDQRAETQGDRWWDGDTWSAAIGQLHQASPLQMTCYVGTLANGGTRYTAHLLHSVYEFGSDTPVFVYEQTEDTVLDRMEIPSDVHATVLDGMRAVITADANETVRRWINESTVPVPIGGKTGTAQNSTDCDNALFVCAAPYNDPEIVVSVVLEQGYTGGYAALTAGRILEEYYEKGE